MALNTDGVRVSGYITPVDSTDVYATHKSIYGHGGYREVADATARLAIPVERLVVGCQVYQADNDTIYKLASIGPNVWSVLSTTRPRRHIASKDFSDDGSTLILAEIDYAHLYCDTSGGATTLVLPTLTAAEDGLTCTFKRLGANTLTISGSIDSGTSFILATDNESVELTYIHSLGEWHITGRFGTDGSLWTDLGSYLQPASGEGINLPATWDGPHIIFGGNHIWKDANGVIRIKATAPTSDTEGLPLGTQS